MGAPEVEAFLTDLARSGVSASTQNQALNAIVFLYKLLLGKELGGIQRRAPTARSGCPWC